VRRARSEGERRRGMEDVNSFRSCIVILVVMLLLEMVEDGDLEVLVE